MGRRESVSVQVGPGLDLRAGSPAVQPKPDAGRPGDSSVQINRVPIRFGMSSGATG